jgi:hypothetical protein
MKLHAIAIVTMMAALAEGHLSAADGKAHRCGPLAELRVLEGRPVVDCVFVNGHGPYRFLVDTGTNVNLIETSLARTIGMKATFQVDLASSIGKTPTAGSDGNEVVIDSVKAGGQKFLFSGMEAIHHLSSDIQGVLGQWFLSQFDYMLDLRGKRLHFGKQNRTGTRTSFEMINARPVISTSLGALALDSGASRLVLFGVQPDIGSSFKAELRTVAGSRQIGMVSGKPLVIQGRKIWGGDAVAIPEGSEPGVDGLMPLSLFKTIYVCNSEGYVVFE